MKIHSPKLVLIFLFFLPAFFSFFLPSNSFAQSIQFHDVTAAAGITPNDPLGFGHGTSFGDFNGDGRPDIYMISYATANFLFRNNGGNFTDIAAIAGVQNPTQSDRGMAAADYDNDGDLDLYIAAGYTGNAFLRNDGGNFTDVTAAANVDLSGQGQGVAWGDYNNDGLLDLFVTQTDGDNVLFRQNSDHTFTNANAAAGIGNFSASLQPVFFDVDNDGDVDLFVARQNNFANLLYINSGNATFTERAGTWGVAATAAHAQGAAAGDYDRDGDLDIYVCDYDGFNLLFRNNGNGFTEVVTSAGVRSGFTGNRGAVFADFNDDGWLDIYVTRSNDNKMYQNNGDGTFNDVSAASGTDDTNNGYSPSIADYDNDGDLDLFFSNTGQNSVLLQNDGPFNNWLQIKLVGNASNRGGVGAKLTGWLNGQRQTQFMISGQAYLCTGSDLTAHFALGSSNKLDSLVIRWPAGTVDRFANLNANQKLTLQEGDGDGGAPDVTPPVISSVSASNIMASTASINWSTNEAADSQVEYGLTTSYGASTSLGSTLLTNHSVALSGLQANTLYHYRVKSKDAAANLATSGDFTFTTSAQSTTILTDDFNTGALDLNKWVKGTNAGNQSAVVGNQLELRSTGTASGWIITKNSYSAVNTTVAIKVTQPNNDGDLGMSPTYTASASNGIFNQNNWYRFYAYRNSSSGPYFLFAQWKKNGVIGGFDVTGNLVINGAVYLRLRFDASNIHFEASLDNVEWTTAYSEAFGLPGYTLNSSFYYELAAYNTALRGVMTVDDFAISNSNPMPDTTPPVISSVAASNITTSSATINWTTDEASDSQAEYGLTTSYGSTTTLGSTLLTNHSMALTGLQANTLYHYRVKSRDAAGNLATSGDFTFTTLANDVTPPIISNVAASSITSSTATINWNTDEASDSQVEYGLTTSYGASTTLNTALVTSHSAGLSGLQANTLYHYRVKSRDAVGNLATSGDFTFTTNAQPTTILADDFNAGTLDLNKWVKGTNAGNQSAVVSNQLELRSTGVVSGWIITKNSYPALNTTVTVKVTQPNNDGDLGMSPAYNAAASSGIFNQNNWYRFYAYRNGSSGPYLLFAQWKKNGVEGGLDVTGSLVINGAVYLRLRFDQTNIHFEASLDNVNWTDTYTEAFGLPGYTLNSSFYYELAAYNTTAKGVLTVDDFSISNNAPTPDMTPPVISSVSASNVTTAAATINWSTNEASDSQVEYGLTTSYGSTTALNTALVTSHSATLSSLQANTLYHYRVKSKDAAGNLATSEDFTFTTLANDVTPPVISSVSASNVTTTAATINWTTNEASDSQVEYGLTTSYGSTTALNTALVTSHSVNLSSLQTNTLYHYRVKSRDAAGNLATNNDFTFTTSAQPTTILADDFNTGTLDLNKWVKGTNAGNQSSVVSNQLELRSTGVVSGWIITKNSYPALNTIVSVKVTQPNNDGDLGMSPTYNASASSGIFNQNNWYRFYAYRNGSSGPYLLFVQWKKNGVDGGLDVTGSLVINGTVYLRLRFDQTNIHFEASLNNVNWTTVYSEAFNLPGYTLNSSFYYELAAYNTSSKGVMTVDDFSISNSDPTPDTTPPVISSVAASNITASSAIINWTTNEASDSQVEYGLTTSYGASTPLNPTLVTSHSAALTGLQSNTLYHYRVKSRDAAGNLAVGNDRTFQTSASVLAFTDITLAAGAGGPTHPDSTGGHAAIFADADGDARPDLYITMYNVPETPATDLFFRNVNGSIFAEEAALRGIADLDGGSHGATFADLDNDGDYDLYNGTTRGATGILGINNIYRNNGNGFFTDVSSTSGIPIREWETRAVVAFDMEGDGDLDLLAITDYLGTDDAPSDRNEVYRNDGNLKFTAINTGALYEARAGQGATDADYDGDGDIDIFAANRTGDVNILRNDGAGNFTLVSPASIGITGQAPDGITMADVDNDNDLDLLLTANDVGDLYLNNGNGTFNFKQNFLGTDGYMGGFADLDNDGDMDLIFAGDDVCYLNDGAGNFVAGPAISVTGIDDPRAIGFADIDNDGDMDFAVGAKKSRNWLVRNDFNAGNWLKVKLISPQGVAGAFGAKTRLYPAGQAGGVLKGWRESRSNNGYLGQDDPVLHFGLGTLTAVDVVVTFLDGTTVTLTNVNAGQTITIDGRNADQTPPVISNVTASNIAASTATVTWTTNEISDSQVEYGLTTSYGASTPLGSTLLTNHSMALSGLQANTLYHYRVKSKDVAGNLATSGDFTFTTSAGDMTPPVISNVAANNVTSSTVTINWNTNEAADSQVEYGLTTSYGALTSLSVTLVTNHAMALSGLQANTLYHYRVKSKDAAGNLAVSGDFTFTTLAPPATIFADDFNAGTLDLNKWVKGTNAGNQSAVVSNQLELRSTGLASGWVITKNSYSALNTTVSFKVTQPNNDGDLGMSPTYTASASSGIFNQNNWYRFYVYRNGSSGPYLLFAQWKKNGVDGGLDVTGSLVINGAVYLRLRFDASNIYFEASLDNVIWTTAYSEAFGLPGYTLNSSFYYELAAYNTAAKSVMRVDDFAISANNTTPDTSPPVISNVTASNVTASSATINWNTDEASDSQVEYGLTPSYDATTPLGSTLLTNHSVALTGLQANTTYHYHVKSQDVAGNLATSDDFTFTTSAAGPGSVAFANVQDVFNSNCTRCHQGATAPANLVLLAGQAHGNIVNVTSTEYPQWQRVQPGSRATSWLYEKISNPTPPVGSKMGSLTPDEIELIGAWIDQGATAAPVPPYADLEFRTITLGNGEINIAYGAGLVVWGGLPPYQFNVIGGALPPGVVLDGASGYIFGSPTVPGQYTFTIRASDSQFPAANVDQTFNIEIFNTQVQWQAPSGFVVEKVVNDLHLPVNIAFVPNPGPNPTDPYFYVTLLYGDIIMVQRNFQKQTYATGVLNFSPTGVFPGSGEMGVTGIAVDPESGDVFASMVYEETPGSEDFRNKVVRFQSTDGGHTAATQTTILSGFPAAISHQIQEVTIGTDGKLYVNTGDGWVSEAAPDLNDLRGKILRMNLDGSAPDDNPIPGNIIFATGFRNPFGAAWRQADGKLYISDNGQETDDRLAKVIAGADYGWGLLSQDLTKGAIHLWNPTVAPVAMDFLHNNSFPSNYFGNLFVGLSGPPYLFGPTPRGKKIQRFVLDAGGQVVSDSVFLDYVGAGAPTVIGVAFGGDGLYFTDLYGDNGFDQFGQTHGNIYRIRWAAADTTRPVISNVLATNVTGTGATIFWQTDEPASRQVEYGPTPSYGLGTPLETNLLTNHSVTLSGLAPETTYHFRVYNADLANNGVFSADFTFATTTIDSIAPVISDVRIDSVSATSALILWSTNEPANSFVDFGLTANYGQVKSASQFVTAHRIWLTGLSDGTLYHFRVRSRDVSSNEDVSGDSAFTTLVNTTLLADHFDSGALNTFNWQMGANAGNQSAVVNNALELKSQGFESGWIITRNAYAARNTTVSLKVAQPNDDGDLGLSPTFNLASAKGISDEANYYRFYVYRASHAGPYQLFAQWKKNGAVADVEVTGNLVINGAVYLRLRFDETNIHFEASLDGVVWTDTYTEAFDLPGYTLDSAFYYELAAYKTATNGSSIIDDFLIAQNPASGAMTKPLARTLETAPLPEKFALQNYPNPFSVGGTATRIRFELPQPAEVEVKIFDLAGRELRDLAGGERPAGSYEMLWNGRGRNDQILSSGVYLVRLRYRHDQNGAWSQLVHRVMMVK